jgi:hypothetical protein
MQKNCLNCKFCKITFIGYQGSCYRYPPDIVINDINNECCWEWQPDKETEVIMNGTRF